MIVVVYPTCLVARFHREAQFRAVPKGNKLRLWAGHRYRNADGSLQPKVLSAYDNGLGIIRSVRRPYGDADIEVPDWVYRAWMENDEPLAPLFDWLLENRADQFPWLEALLHNPTFVEPEEGDRWP